MPTAYVNARVFTGEQLLEDHAVISDQGRITDVVPAATLPAGLDTIDLQGAFMAPALIDLQIYGGNGKLFSLYPDVEALTAIYEYSKAGGAAYFMPTVATISSDIMLKAIEAVREYWAQGLPGVLGLHLEGPFINPVKKGAHLSQYIRTPAQEDIDWILENGSDVVKMITLAPECCDPALVAQLREAGITVFAGHSNATYAQAYTSFNEGVHHATHLFNAMSPLESRAPGLVGAVYDHPQVYASVVADGIHVDFASIRISKKIMGQRLFLITDAVEENHEGHYIYIREKDRYVSGTGVLSGSCLTMLQAVRNCVKNEVCSIREALRMASLYPARALGLDDRLGRIAAGCEAVFLVMPKNGETVVYS
ncbi:N-acetylglucosamine-6-phosphate deacetylase [Chitinophaga vietnamensis]|uniref:N-acetylglucosamine-6-phosphate deacetylase n=1 Tax=Chitinophaga vietnamensis TaxID=2593957 RepID=UPI00117865B3|nr:N-acetylglucosamine-6-phosphate deacetylase [Chitinophaga vietnamensis]